MKKLNETQIIEEFFDIIQSYTENNTVYYDDIEIFYKILQILDDKNKKIIQLKKVNESNVREIRVLNLKYLSSMTKNFELKNEYKKQIEKEQIEEVSEIKKNSIIYPAATIKEEILSNNSNSYFENIRQEVDEDNSHNINTYFDFDGKLLIFFIGCLLLLLFYFFFLE